MTRTQNSVCVIINKRSFEPFCVWICGRKATLKLNKHQHNRTAPEKCLTSTETIRLIRDGHRYDRNYSPSPPSGNIQGLEYVVVTSYPPSPTSEGNIQGLEHIVLTGYPPLPPSEWKYQGVGAHSSDRLSPFTPLRVEISRGWSTYFWQVIPLYPPPSGNIKGLEYVVLTGYPPLPPSEWKYQGVGVRISDRSYTPPYPDTRTLRPS